MARDLKVKVRLEAEDRASREIAKVSKTSDGLLGTFKKIAAFTGITVTLGLITKAFQSTLVAASEYQTALVKLTSAAGRFGSSQDAVVTAAKRQASALQSITGVSDTLIVSQQKLLLEMGVTSEQLGQATQASLDLSAALGISLESAARNIGRTMGGFAGELGELIPELKTLDAEALKAGEGIDLLAEKFQGRAAEAARSFEGELRKLNAAWGDFQKGVGGTVASSEGAADSLVALRGIVELLTQTIKDSGGAFDDANIAANSFGPTLTERFADVVRGADTAKQALRDILESLKDAKDASNDAATGVENLGDSLEETAAKQTSAVNASDEYAATLDRLGVALEGNVNREIRDLNVFLAENYELLRQGEITATDYANVQAAVAREIAELRGEVTGTNVALEASVGSFQSAAAAANGYARAVSQAVDANERFGESQSAGLTDTNGGGASFLRLSVDQLLDLRTNPRNTLPIGLGGGLFRVNADGSRELIPGTGNFIRNQSFNGRG